ncbi:MAG: hypothetical protein NTU43_11650 [Bacteroidetes bacterium]|nr:hypothetical protein [Bacteroidota bacterium]
MKKYLLLVVLLFQFYTNNESFSQVFDTISYNEFKHLKNRQIKSLFENDDYALHIINKNRKRKIIAYSLDALCVPFAVTLNPTVQLPLLAAFLTHIKNTKRILYSKLYWYENKKYSKDTIQMAISQDTNDYRYKYQHHIFDLSYQDFKSLVKTKQYDKLIINDTIQFIFDYYKNRTWLIIAKNTFGVGSSILGLYGLIFTPVLSNELPLPLKIGFLSMSTGLCVGGYYLMRGNESKNKKIYSMITQYYKYHRLDNIFNNYIKRKKKFYLK